MKSEDTKSEPETTGRKENEIIEHETTSPVDISAEIQQKGSVQQSTTSLNKHSIDELDSDDEEQLPTNMDPNAGEHLLFQNVADIRRKSLASQLGVQLHPQDYVIVQKLIEEVKRLYAELALKQLAKAFEDPDTPPPTEEQLNATINSNIQFKQAHLLMLGMLLRCTLTS